MQIMTKNTQPANMQPTFIWTKNNKLKLRFYNRALNHQTTPHWSLEEERAKRGRSPQKS